MNKRLSVYDEVFRRADELAAKSSGGIILDATFVTQELRRRAAEIAAKNKMTFVILQTSCPQEVSIARIMKRTKEKYESNALTEEAYLANKNKFEPVDIDDIKKKYPTLKVTHLTVDTCHNENDLGSLSDWRKGKVTTMKIDLHIHSKTSDGKFTVEEILKEAKTRNIRFHFDYRP